MSIFTNSIYSDCGAATTLEPQTRSAGMSLSRFCLTSSAPPVDTDGLTLDYQAGGNQIVDPRDLFFYWGERSLAGKRQRLSPTRCHLRVIKASPVSNNTLSGVLSEMSLIRRRRRFKVIVMEWINHSEQVFNVEQLFLLHGTLELDNDQWEEDLPLLLLWLWKSRRWTSSSSSERSGDPI